MTHHHAHANGHDKHKHKSEMGGDVSMPVVIGAVVLIAAFIALVAWRFPYDPSKVPQSTKEVPLLDTSYHRGTGQ